MKIGLVIYGSLDTISGGYLYDRMLVEKLRERGDSVEVVSIPRRAYAMNLLDNLKDWPPAGLDVIVQDELNHPSLFLANRRPRQVPIITIVHHLRSSERRSAAENAFYRRIERMYLTTADGFVFNSEQTRISVQRLTGKAMPSVVATPGGNRLGTTEPAHVRARAAEPGPLRVVFVGSLTPAKGLAVLLGAMGHLPKEQVHLDVIGPEEAMPAFVASMHRLAQARRLSVTFWGTLNEHMLATRLQHAHVLAVPSYFEGFGIVFLEGMAHGLPALGTFSGAVPEVVTDGEHGYLIQPGDIHALAERLGHLAQDRKLLARLGEAALRRYGEFPTWDQTTERIRDFLLTVSPRSAGIASKDVRQE